MLENQNGVMPSKMELGVSLFGMLIGMYLLLGTPVIFAVIAGKPVHPGVLYEPLIKLLALIA